MKKNFGKKHFELVKRRFGNKFHVCFNSRGNIVIYKNNNVFWTIYNYIDNNYGYESGYMIRCSKVVTAWYGAPYRQQWRLNSRKTFGTFGEMLDYFEDYVIKQKY